MNAKNCSIVALVTGIISVALPWFNWVLALICLVCAVVAIVFAAKAKKLCAEENAPTGMATAGLVLGIIGAAIAAITAICGICAAVAICQLNSTLAGGLSEFESGLNELNNLLS